MRLQLSLVCCLCVFRGALNVAGSEVVHKKKLGDEVVLSLGATYATTVITSILWKHGNDIAVDWNGHTLDAYRQFKERGSVNVSTGALTITGLVREDSGDYTPEINSVIANPIRLIVIAPVPKPTVSITCNHEKTYCSMRCNGDDTHAEPLFYNWKFGDQVKTHSSQVQNITKEDTISQHEFTCELENSVSRESSNPISNPFTASPGEDNLNIQTGILIFISLLTAVAVLIGIHRWKSGEWFYQKESMPWEADFWRRQGSRGETNGDVAHQEERLSQGVPQSQ